MNKITLNPRQDWTSADEWTPQQTYLTRIYLNSPKYSTRHIHGILATTPDRPLWARIAPTQIITRTKHPLPAHQFHPIAEQMLQTTETLPALGARISLAGIANATITTTHGEPRRNAKKRRISVPIDQRAEWLAAKLEGVINMTLIETEPLAPILVPKPTGLVTIDRTGYYATGAVANTHRLAYLLANGVGHGRAYGCGLLLVQEAK